MSGAGTGNREDVCPSMLPVRGSGSEVHVASADQAGRGGGKTYNAIDVSSRQQRFRDGRDAVALR